MERDVLSAIGIKEVEPDGDIGLHPLETYSVGV